MKAMKGLITLTIVLTHFYYSCAKNYENYTLFNLYLDSSEQRLEQRQFLINLDKKKQLDVIFPEMPPENSIIKALIHRRLETEVLKRFTHYGITYKKISDNAQEFFDYKLSKGVIRRSMGQSVHSLSQIYNWLKTKTKFPYTNLQSIGKSAEDRDIYAFSIKIPPRPNYSNLKVIIEAAIHGNEWGAVSACMHMIDQILNATTGPYSELKKKYFLYFIPVMNPDGYEYSVNQDPLWVKNRRKTGANTFGVNLNRNFPYMFGEHDSSDDPMSDKYHGPNPFSEPETLAFKEFMYRKRSQLMFYFSIHGHGQKFILPYSDSTKHVVNFHEVEGVTKKAIKKIMDLTGNPFRVGLAKDLLDKLYSGDSASWVKKTYHVPFTITVQLRDNGEQGLTLRSEEVDEASEEIAHGLTSLMLSSGRYQSFDNNAAMRHNVYTSLLMILVSLLIFN